jgi:hypothetical protein
VIRLVYLLRRRRDLELHEFHEHWLEHHVVAYGEPIRAIRRYVLYTAVPGQPVHGAEEPYDGMASVWLDDVQTLAAVMDGAMPEAGRDEARFIDHGRSRAFLVDDTVVVEPDAPAPIVLFACLARAPGASPEDFARCWRQRDDAVREAHADGRLQGYIRSSVLTRDGYALAQFDALGGQSTAWDGVAGIYFHSVVLARRYLEAARGGTVAPLADDAIDGERTTLLLARRHLRREPIR